MMIKDKPGHVFTPTRPSWRWHRNLALSITAVLSCIYYFVLSSPSASTHSLHPLTGQPLDWSLYAYSQYATNQHYLCNSLMLFDRLTKLDSRADRLLFYPKLWDTEVSSPKDRTSQLLVMARDKYNVKLRPVDMYSLRRQTPEDEETWDASVNKLYAWRESHYDRIIHLDSDIDLLGNIDELFFLPHSAKVAMPRAYWKPADSHKLTSLLVVLEPNTIEAEILWSLVAGLDNSSYTDSSRLDYALFDMELLNDRYADHALVLPHRNYALVTGEFRRTGRHNHSPYLGNEEELWDPQKALLETKIVHFSDWPLPKPWIMWPNQLLREMQPACEFDNGTPDEHGCEDRKVWKDLYDEFRKRRKDVCKLLSVPAPDWPPRPRKKIQAEKQVTDSS